MAAATRTIFTKKFLSELSSDIKPFCSIPGPKPLPVIGNIWRYLPIVGEYKIDTLFENALYNKQRYGPIVREKITNEHTILHLFDPDDIKSFIKQDSSMPHRRSHRALHKYRCSLPGRYRDGGLFPENGKSWLRIRKLFQLRNISDKLRLIDQVAQTVVKEIDDRLANSSRDSLVIENFEQLIYEWALKSSLSLFLNFELDETLKQKTMSQLLDRLHDQLVAIDGTEIKSETWTRKPDKCPFFNKLANSEDFLYQFVEQRIDYLSTTDRLSRRKDSLLYKWLLIDNIHRHDVIAFIIDSILASLHTSTYTTLFLLYNISESQSRDKLYKELANNLTTDPLTEETLAQQANLSRHFKETLRLNPIAIGTGRLTQTEMVIRNFSIPKNIMIIAQTQAICRDPNVYYEPDRFLPERWLEYEQLSLSQRNLAQFAALKPFGFGPRICIGKSVASAKITILTARLLNKFRLQFPNGLKTKTTLIHTIDGPVSVTIKRSQS